MPYNDSSSPARRSQVNERTVSSQSISRASPTAGHTTKAPSQKKHMAHATGHHRHSHTKIPSYGKNLNKLSKLTAVQPADVQAQAKQHVRTRSQTPSSSPTPTHIKRNSSNVSLPRTGSKGLIQKHPSVPPVKRNNPTGKTAVANKSQIRPSSRNGSAGDLPSRGRAKFSIGDEDQDEEEWVAASGSQSPDIVRQDAKPPKPPQLEEPPSPDDPQGPSPPILPHSPPQSPPMRTSEIANQVSAERRDHLSAPNFHPPDPEMVTHRLLSRHRGNNAAPQMSSISATVTPSGSSGSPALSHGLETGLSDPSMPADGISRFLNTAGNSSGSVTPGSISQLQSALAIIHRGHQHDHRSNHHSPDSSPMSGNLEAIRRAKSTGNLSTPHAASGIAQSVSPPQVPTPSNTRASPFKSANEPREAARSLTQLKLDLQRLSSNRIPIQPPSVQPPLAMIHGAYAMTGMSSAVSGELSAERRIRQYEQAGLEFRNARRFNNMLTSGLARVEKRREKKKSTTTTRGGKEKDEERTHRASSVAAGATKSLGRGRVRFEIGRKEAEGDDDEEDEGGGGGFQGLLKRMWEVETYQRE